MAAEVLPPGVTIEQATADDGEAIADVRNASWRWAYAGLLPDAVILAATAERDRRVALFARLAATPEEGHRVWVARRAGAVIGFATTGASRDEDAASAAEISAIYLVPSAAGLGIGRALLARAVDDLWRQGYPEATLWVLATNARARRFYEAAGWRPDGKEKWEEWPAGTLHEVRYRIQRPGRSQTGRLPGTEPERNP